jgi:hypothetical protein
MPKQLFLGAPRCSVRDIHEVYRMFGEMICGTHMVHMGSLNARKQKKGSFLTFRGTHIHHVGPADHFSMLHVYL